MKILVGVGHQNIKYNSIVALRGNTGTQGELEVNLRVGNRLSELLRGNGFEVKQTDANANDDPTVTGQDWDLAIILHCDMDYPNDNGSGFADYPEPSTDGATEESQRITGIVNKVYFPETKINYVNRSNKNTRYYYLWKYLSAATPCCIIEMGQAQDPHDKVLLANTELIAGALNKSICEAFGVEQDVCKAEKEQIGILSSKVIELEKEIETIKNKNLEEINALRLKIKEDLENLANNYK